MRTRLFYCGMFMILINLACMLPMPLMAEDSPAGTEGGFRITSVRSLSRNDSDSGLSAIYAAVDCGQMSQLPELELFYTVNLQPGTSNPSTDRIFTVIPMFCLNPEVFKEKSERDTTYLYRAEIPVRHNGALIEYFVYGKQSTGEDVVFPAQAPVQLNQYIVGASGNPFQAKPREE